MAENAEKRLRTKGALKKALVALCEEKGCYAITVAELYARAGLYRSTFYETIQPPSPLAPWTRTAPLVGADAHIGPR
ncbi:MAG: hypothetical protein ACSW8F_06550, partial [bacterium]